MNRQATRAAFLAAAVLGSGSAVAVDIQSRVTGFQVAVRVTNPDGYCGVELDFGDGQTSKLRIGSGESQVVQHQYAQSGAYVLEARPKLIVAGLKTAGPCVSGAKQEVQVGAAAAAQAPAQTPAASPAATPEPTPTPEPKPSSAPARDKGLLVFVHTETSNFQLLKKLDGGQVWRDGDRLRGDVNYCVIHQDDTFDADEAALMPNIISPQLAQVFQSLGAKQPINFKAVSCLERQGNEVRIQTRAAPVVLAEASFDGQLNQLKGWRGYAQIATWSSAQISARLEAAKADAQARLNEQAEAQRRFEALAASGATTHMASISLAYPSRREALKICSRELPEDAAQASAGYFAAERLPVSAGFIDAAVKANATIDRGQPVTRRFKDLDAFYLAWQRDPRVCQVLVDYPQQLQRFIQAAEGANGLRYELNAVLPVEQLREQWAQRQGHESLDAWRFAAAIGGSAATVKALAELGVGSQADYDAAAKRMQGQGYAQRVSSASVLTFLRDEAQARSSGKTAVAVRDARDRAKQEAAAQRAQKQRAEREAKAKAFPYYAVLSCGFGNSNYAVMACFSGAGKYGKNTTIKLSANGVEREYQIYDIANNRVGRETRDGLRIDLPKRFYIRAQNANDTLALTLSVHETASGRRIAQKQAGSKYGVVSYMKR